MIDFLTRANAWLNSLVLGPPMLVLLVGVGVLLTVVTGGVQSRRLWAALAEVLGKIGRPATGQGTVTPFQAVATALASTVGVGNIAGVATRSRSADPARCSGSGVGRVRDGHQVLRDRRRAALPGARRRGRHARRRHVHSAPPQPALARLDLRPAHRARGVRHREHGAGELGGPRPS